MIVIKQVLQNIEKDSVLTWKEKMFWAKLYFTHESVFAKKAKEGLQDTIEMVNEGNEWQNLFLFLGVATALTTIFFLFVANILKAILWTLGCLLGISVLGCLAIFLLAFVAEAPRNLIIFFTCYKFERATLERILVQGTNKADILVHAPDGVYKSSVYPRQFYELHEPQVIIARNKINPEQIYIFNVERKTAQKYSEKCPLALVKPE